MPIPKKPATAKKKPQPQPQSTHDEETAAAMAALLRTARREADAELNSPTDRGREICEPPKQIYLAGGLFNAGERLHNLYLEKYLVKLGYRVLLPQRRALSFVKNGIFDLKAVVQDCQTCCTDSRNWYCGSLDGTDADSGTAVEYGMAITSTGRAIVYRTDFRTDMVHEIGVNGMFHAESTSFVYEPCFFTDLSEVDSFYEKLANRIDAAIKERY